ncbi:protein-(glutamine-N5) methyltransferase, release factor-specific [Canicola haemoglobinophilus]|uniref:Release factor glutamine methyltransferase n=1 Tax=Canicola haemoglobinophilus TaxID=733 RepID=A0A1V4B3P3_9PAST|nr:peptide chain release factor N(5)-glutamine methyltransferase [Canicola haemoglobinophilus]OOS01999.1 protein-(glutamine-N5) methyltransferase, release factor-specific [Canicola haemoglobinophilus]STO54111.1 peptide release factor glutamine N(5)-methylase [Canicola haemoglobinophilus]STO60453.1 peptide release factor glutamine N(5)-methylase [Canicola haemoglobinophilus]STO68644.1 peptide release factor glutamine N(5)-methylase [Canicola haemoglobinophilus]
MNYSKWLNYAIQQLESSLASDPYLNAKLDASLLLQFVTQKSASQIMAFAEMELDEKTLAKLTALLSKRSQGEPMAYVLGETDFWILTLNVSPDTLIPRPDTEILVEQALACIKQLKDSTDFKQSPIRILDLGTGTGAIALALAYELKKSGEKFEIFGVDFIENAVKLARANAVRNHLSEVQFFQSNWFEQVTGQFDLILSNPPYINAEDPHLAQGDVRFEPLTALVAEDQGYADLRHIIEQASHYLKPQGFLLLEHGWQQGQKVRSFFSENLWQRVETVKDYGSNDRVTLGQLRGNNEVLS